MALARCTCAATLTIRPGGHPVLVVDYFDPDCNVIMHRLEAEYIQTPQETP